MVISYDFSFDNAGDMFMLGDLVNNAPTFWSNSLETPLYSSWGCPGGLWLTADGGILLTWWDDVDHIPTFSYNGYQTNFTCGYLGRPLMTNGTIYVAGNTNITTGACLWYSTDGGSNFTAIFLTGGDAVTYDSRNLSFGSGFLYVAGVAAGSVPCYWTIDTATWNVNLVNLPMSGGGTGACNTIEARNGTVYAAGQDNTVPCYWVNGIEYLLPAGVGGSVYALNVY
jgi:hypothetical protein